MQAAVTEYHGPGGFSNRTLFLTIVESEKCKIRVSADLMSGEDLPGSQVRVFSLCPHRVEEGIREQSGASYIRTLILFMRAPPSVPSHFSKAPPINIITLGIRFFSTFEFFGDMST